jgi:acyl-CoA dehydrogenase
MVPEKVCNIIDEAMQVHGATGISQWSPLSHMYTSQRTLRYADGPDEVHHHVIARAEVKDYQASNSRTDRARSEIATGRERSGV